jgi:predicted Zn-dependent protease
MPFTILFSEPARSRTFRICTARLLSDMARRAVALLVVLALSIVPMAASRQANAAGIQILRDTEVESFLRDLAAPIFRIAGLNPSAVNISIIEDSTLNAFVAGGLNMFFHTGLLLAADSPEEIVGVMAHETGHIAGGHLIRLREAARGASRQAILTMILGMAAAIGTGRGDVGAAAITAGQQVAGRSILSFSRAQEASADAAGLGFLEQAGLSANGFLTFMEKLGEQDLLPTNRQSEYVRTHPLTRDRIDVIRTAVKDEHDVEQQLDADMQERFRRMQAKLLAYLQPRVAYQKYPRSDNSIAAQYARSIALWRSGDIENSLKALDALIKAEPQNPYFLEQKAQILFESGKVAEAAESLKQASSLAPQAPLIQVAYAHALIETGGEANLAEAEGHLQIALQSEPDNSFAHRLLALSYGRRGLEGPARLHLAEEAVLKRDLPAAKAHLEMAKELISADDRQNLIRVRDLENEVAELDTKMKEQ